MFERFTERARNVMVLAQEEARRFEHNYIGTEHILLGLVRESEGVASIVLRNLDVDPDEISCEVAELLGGGRVSEGRMHGCTHEPYLARVTGIEVEARFGLSEEERAKPQRLRVDLEYAHEELDLESAGRNPYRAAGETALSLEQRPFRDLVDGVERVGLFLLTSVPEARRVVVTVNVLQTPSERGTPTVSLTGTFRQ